MIRWIGNVRTTQATAGSVDQIKRRVKWRKKTSAVNYCVAFALSDNNMFDIFNMGELAFRMFMRSGADITIVGIAESKDAAIELAGSLIKETFEATGGFDVRNYFK